MQEDHKIDSASLAVTSEASTDAQGDDRVVHPSSRLWRPLEPTVVVAQIASVCGCIATIGLVAWGKAARPNDGKGVTDVFGGSCEQVNRLSTFAHLGLNVPAVIILASGSAALWRIAEKGLGAWRTPAWWLLFLALLFTPVFWNAVLFPAPIYSDVLVAHVAPSFVAGAPYQDDPIVVNDGWLLAETVNMDAIARLQEKANSSELVRLDVAECHAIRGAPYVSEWTALLLVSDFEATTDTIIKIYQHKIDFPVKGLSYSTAPRDTYNTTLDHQWALEVPFCNGTRDAHSSSYDIGDRPRSCRRIDSVKDANVQYCLGERLRHPCLVRMSSTMLVILLALQLLVVALLALLRPTAQSVPDETPRYAVALMWMTFSFMIVTLISAVVACVRGISEPSMTAAWKNLSFGQVDPAYIVHMMPGIVKRDRPLLTSLFAANLPQLLAALPGLLLTRWFPGLFYQAGMRRTLLVALALPFYALLVLLGWFASQSLFPVQFMWYDADGRPRPELDIISEGYTLNAITAAFVAYTVLILLPFIVPSALFDWKDNTRLKRVPFDHLPLRPAEDAVQEKDKYTQSVSTNGS